MHGSMLTNTSSSNKKSIGIFLKMRFTVLLYSQAISEIIIPQIDEYTNVAQIAAVLVKNICINSHSL
jgi:hypothetical protein